MEWNDRRRTYPDRLLHQLLEVQARETPEAVAVVAGDDHLSYAELDRSARRLAERLRSRAVGPEVVVGVCLEGGLELPLAILAVLKAGGAWVPLDPAYPPRRLRFMVRDARISVLLTQCRLGDRLAVKLPTLCLDSDRWQPPGSRPSVGVSAPVGEDNVAYVIYTSGSTGKPKGVAVSHRAVVNRLHWSQEALPLKTADRVLQQASASFDFSIWELFAPWLAGAQVIMVPSDQRRDPDLLAKLLDTAGITVAHFVPSLLAELKGRLPGRLGRLRRIFSGGEALSATLRDRVLSELDTELVNQYGPTEATIDATFAPCRRGDDDTRVAIGRPIANTRAHLLDSRVLLVPLGGLGEIHVGGAALARGYLGRAARTASGFVPDPWNHEPGERLYRTGDLARYLDDGALEFAGRRDHQLKLRGLRIEPGEIESALESHPGVQRAVVLVFRADERPDGAESAKPAPADSRLVAFVTPERLLRTDVGSAVEAATVTAEALRGWLQERLPDFMVPADFQILDALPATPAGKVDRRRLGHRARRGSRSGRPSERSAPRNPQEEILAEIWSEVLGVTPIGVHDNFLELGGHSLLAARVVSRIRRVLRLEVSVKQLFEQPTIASLAHQLMTLRAQDAPMAGLARKPELGSGERPDLLPLSFAQERLWFLDRLEPLSPAYNLPSAWRLVGSLDVGALERSLREIARRHEVLRTRFPSAGGEPRQEILERPDLRLLSVDLERLVPERRQALSRALAAGEALRPFDLERGPLLRAKLIKLARQEHVLLLTLHHVVSDGWSQGVFNRELSALYEANAIAAEGFRESDGARVLPEITAQVADFAVWQRGWLQGEVLEAQWSYWQRQLGGRLSVLELPADRPRPASLSYRGVSYRWSLDRQLTVAIQQVGRVAGASLYMALLAAFSAFLHRLTLKRQILVGSPIAGRDSEAAEDLIGLFVNTLVMHAAFDDGLSFKEHLERVKATALAAYDHQELPFEKLVEMLQPERDNSSNPLFRVTLALQNGPRPEPRLVGLEIQPFETGGACPARVDLALYFREHEGRLEGTMIGLQDLFDRSTISRFCGTFETLLRDAVSDLGRRIASLSMLNPAQRHQLLVEWSGSAEGGARECLHHPFEARVTHAPEKVALVFEDQRLSYRGLDRRAGQIARSLPRAELLGDGIVGICLERGPELVASVLAVLRSGGAYLILDPAHPRARRRLLLAASGGSLLLTTASLAMDFVPWDGVILCLDEPRPCGALERLDFASGRIVDAGRPAYVTYTSGTTGRAKGVVTSHRAVARYLSFIVRSYALKLADVVLQIASLAFDRSIRDLFAPLSAGATVVLSKATSDEPEAILREVEMQRVTCLPSMVPSLLRQLSDLRADGSGRSRSVDVRLLLFAGERFTWADRRRARDLFGAGARQVNLYGPTEGTCTATSQGLTGLDGDGVVAIGRPHEHVSIYLFDRAFHPVAVGAAGELTLAGAGLARGYLGDPAATARVFVPSPLTVWPGQRLYRTGDLARYRGDGRLELLGRIDHQLKIRGFRVEPGEVEAALDAHPAVRAAAVVGRRDDAGDDRLIAYVQASEPRAQTLGADLRRDLQRLFPGYLVPSLFVPLQRFPLTATGKVDRRALARRQDRQPPATDSGDRRMPPNDPIEEILIGIWRELLGSRRIGVHEDFFELGGHSLLAARVISRIRRLLGVELPLRRLFERPTVAGLASEVAAARQDSALLAPELEAAARPREVPLSFAQERLWLLDRIEPMSAAYNMATAWRLEGRLDVSALGRALKSIVHRHEVLRTLFPLVFDRPCQAIQTRSISELPIVDLERLAHPARRREARRLAAVESARPFDLTRGPLLRVTLLRLGGDRHVLLLTIHHIVSDAWSQGNLYRELAILYRSASAEEPPVSSPLPELPVQYADYALWQRGWLSGTVLDEHLAYWQKQLAGLSTLSLPADRPRSAMRADRGGVISMRLPVELLAELRRLSSAAGTTLFMSLLAGFATLLSRLSGQRDIAIGSPIAGRSRAELEPLIGNFTNTLVLRTDLSSETGNPLSFCRLLERVRSMALEAYAHQDMPFERLVESLRPARSLNVSPLFQVMFVLHNGPGRPLRLPGIQCALASGARSASKFDLSLSLRETVAGLSGEFVYKAELFDSTRIRRLASHLTTLFGALAEHPGRALVDLPLLNTAERQQIVVEWNDTSQTVPKGGPGDQAGERQCLHHLLEKQAGRSPDAIALTFAARLLSYRRLDVHAAGLARILCGLGVGRGDVVPFLVRPGLEVPVACLAIMKSGAAYAPLDVRWPRQRIAQALCDLDAKVVLVDEPSLNAFEDHLDRQRLLVVSCSRGSFRAMQAAGARARPAAGVRPSRSEDPIYAIYTSGSTGRPKAALNTHGGIVNRLQWMERQYGRAGDRVILQTTHHTFDSSVWQLFWPLLHGARSVLPAAGDGLDLEDLVDVIERERVTLTDFVPSVFDLLVERLENEPHQRRRLAGLWQLILGGESSHQQTIDRFKRFFPNVGFTNLYGPTETAIGVISYRLPQAADSRQRSRRLSDSIPIGRPIDNTAALILSPELVPVPVGIPGDVYLGGVCVGLGYLGDSELSDQVFIANPFPEISGTKLYKTGDLARHRADGNIEFLGRTDHQVKIRGFRVEPAEIENTLVRHPAIESAAVVVRQTSPQGSASGGRRLVAYLTLRHQDAGSELSSRYADQPAGSALSGAELRGFLEHQLPHYMVPSELIRLDALPLTPGGKVDRVALSRDEELPTDAVRLKSTATSLMPRGPVEEKLAKIWSEVLGRRDIGVRDDFFAAGGHSLLAVRLMSRIERRFQVRLPLSSLFDRPTIEGLAGRIVRGGASGLSSPLVQIRAASAPSSGSSPEGSSRPRPFFCVHPIGGQVLCYRDLAENLDADQPFYGLQARGCDDGEVFDQNIESMAARYLEAIRTIQPRGPYRVGGWSMGGVVAYEIAQLLRRHGEELDALVLIDTSAPAAEQSGGATLTSRLEAFAKNLGLARCRELAAVSGLDDGLLRVLESGRRAGILSADIDLERVRHLYRLFESNLRALRAYVPAGYPGRVTLLRASQRPTRGNSALGWSGLAASGVEVHPVPGDHYTMLREPHVRILADRVTVALKGSQSIESSARLAEAMIVRA